MQKKVTGSTIAVWFLDLLLIAFLVLDFGFENFEDFKIYKLIALPVLVISLIAFNLFKYRSNFTPQKEKKVARVNLILLSVLLAVELVFIFFNFKVSIPETIFKERYVIEYGLLMYFFTRLAFLMRRIYSLFFNPAILFVGSFAIIALAGTFLLMLPAATNNGISFIDALFTATSATAVTGLIVLDTAKDFTTFGQSVIMLLFQIGGLGMLTFTSFFAYFFKSGSSFNESLYMKDILGQENLSGVMKMTMSIVVFSLVLEGIGAALIYSSLEGINSYRDRGFFAVFHAISAYCNAGFSLSSEGLYAAPLRFNYYMQWVVMGLIIFGGLGYSIASNFIQYLKKLLFNLFNRKNKKFISRVITLNTKIVMYTTIILITAGTVFFMFSEQETHLLEHTTPFGKFTTAMFNSVTARTAGFNTVDMESFTVPGLLFMIFLMWIGASPASTGGGIKTTTFALATLNIFSIAKNKPSIEMGTRQVAKESVSRAFAIISISLASIATGILLLLIFNPQFTLLEIAFEVFSAFSTVGLSLGITPELNEAGKYVVVFLMFFGRIGLINLMIGILKNVNTSEYKYPEENILIN